MTDTVKLIIEIPKDIYERCKEYKLWSYDAETLEGAVATSKPLSEVVADVKAEIQRTITASWYNGENYKKKYRDGLNDAIEILDNIGKESEAKKNDS